MKTSCDKAWNSSKVIVQTSSGVLSRNLVSIGTALATRVASISILVANQADTSLKALYCNNLANSRSLASRRATSSASTSSPCGSNETIFRSNSVAAITRNSLACSISSCSSSCFTYWMNSSVTRLREISVMSSSCLEMSVNSRSNGPSKLLSVSAKPLSFSGSMTSRLWGVATRH